MGTTHRSFAYLSTSHLFPRREASRELRYSLETSNRTVTSPDGTTDNEKPEAILMDDRYATHSLNDEKVAMLNFQISQPFLTSASLASGWHVAVGYFTAASRPSALCWFYSEGPHVKDEMSHTYTQYVSPVFPPRKPLSGRRELP